MGKKIKLFTLSLLVLSALAGCKKEENKDVNIYMWGGSKEINKFMDDVVTPKVLEKDGINLKRVPIVDIKDVVNKLIIEKQAGKKNGVIDILWVNGENFKALKDAKVLEENILAKVENKDLLKESTTVKDFGETINGLEVPFGEAQFNFIYNTKNGKIPFTGWETLTEYVKKNPGKFTYPNANNFTGSAFVRNIVIDMLGYDNIQKMTPEEFKQNLNLVWNYLNEIEPYLWRKGETYPESEGKLDLLYSTGEVNVTMGYTINKVNSKIESKEYPDTSQSFLLNKGTLFNNHYLAIPKNAQNKSGALIVINELISPEMQLLKQEPKNWGDFNILDMRKLTPETVKKFFDLNKSGKIPSPEELQEKRVMELTPDKLKVIEEGWIENVGKN
ncbi:ABC transporter substrate-binding protein [Cetobacterium somerae]|uniref:ABC transporter substrate-binding protein n=1 Tax=Cetobacterium sp. NK01 TaxID=2993530 RepID=UPI002116E721|nr:ABC transporter substrate-binding protein [Cetobacterium sp. NK01]MCQ8211047.1 ABC transporter substrate-binding protein [Cetobacterium sp. NK01]